MYAVVQVGPETGWLASVKTMQQEELLDRDTVEAWLREQLPAVLRFQKARGGGLFLLAVPEALFD